ncbi:MAG: LURP-one-related family protein [Acholeplasmataceae bacterium]|nr:LURP-one-related family protein [Acholeplasmataceae bacterium]
MKHFYLKQKVFSLTDRYKVFDENQNVVYYVKSKVFSIHRKMKFIDQSNDEVIYNFKRKLFYIMPNYLMLDANLNQIALVKRKFSFFRPKVFVEKEGMNFNIEGDYFAHSFQVFNGMEEVASVTKKWLSWGDSYQITIHDDKNDVFYLALVILIDSMFHDNKNKRHF